MRVLNQLSKRRSAFLDAAGVWAAPAPASPIPSAASSFLRCSRHFAASFLQKSPISSQHLCGNQIYGAFARPPARPRAPDTLVDFHTAQHSLSYIQWSEAHMACVSASRLQKYF